LANNAPLDGIFLSKDHFSREVEELVLESGLSLLEAIVTKMDEKGLEYERAKKFLTASLVERLELETREFNLLKKDPSLEKKTTISFD